MLRWIIKTVWVERWAVFASAGGVGAAFILVIALEAVFVGESNQIVAYIRHTDADVWVMQKGVSNMHMATTFVWDWKVERIAEMPGVKSAIPILYVNTVVKAGGRNWFAYIIGLRPAGERAGPWSMSRGRRLPGFGEIVLPKVYAEMADIKIGDLAEIADKVFTVVGFSEGTFSMANSIAFVAFSDLEDLLSISGTVSFVLVDAEQGQDPEELARRIEQDIDKVSAIPQQRFINNDFQIALLMGVEIVYFMTVTGASLAALIVAFVAYSQVSRRRREMAIIKALGFPNRALYVAVIVQTVIVTGLALVLALAASWTVLPAISALVPQVTLTVTAASLAKMGMIALLVAIAAALVPAHFVTRVDPISAFKV